MKARVAISLSLAVLIALASTLLLAPPSKAEGGLGGKKVCIDPGHGGSDPGAVNVAFSLEESEINLDVSYGLKALLEADGAVVVMTRPDDSPRSNNDRYTFCNGELATILVSVHTNSVANSTSDGTLALYMKKSDVPLAQAIHNAAWASLQPVGPGADPFTDFGLERFASGVLLKSTMPSTIAEPLFMSNAGEAELLGQRIYGAAGSGVLAAGCQDFGCRRGQIALALRQGIADYFSAAGPTPTPAPAPTPTRCRGKSCS